MAVGAILADAFFDGDNIRQNGPYLIETGAGLITAITCGPDVQARLCRIIGQVLRTPFLLPGLVDGHVHLFLDGAEQDFAARSAHLKAGFAAMMDTAQANAARLVKSGVTLVRDAGDRFGINTGLRDALAQGSGQILTVRSAGVGLKRPKRYGGFIARDWNGRGRADDIVSEIATRSDDLKIILTGIIDFERGEVRGEPQFDTGELRALVTAAHKAGLKTLVHCSGLAGLKVAVAAGVDSIEHGFFMTREILLEMADRQICWVPTFSPVQFQWQQPKLAGWNDRTVANLRRILDQHQTHLALGVSLGVPIIAGTDAGSYGVCHGPSLSEELTLMLSSGLRLQDVLAAATSRPRALWSMASANIAVGNGIDVVGLGASPVVDIRALAKPSFSFKTGTLMLN